MGGSFVYSGYRGVGMRRLFGRIVKDEKGQDLIEYGLLLTLIAVATVAAINAIGPRITQLFTNAQTAISGS